MTLDEIRDASKKAYKAAQVYLVDSIGSSTLIKSVAVRIDDDGTTSVLLFTKRHGGQANKKQEQGKR